MREDGFYWVKPDWIGSWVICEFKRGGWHFCGDDQWCTDCRMLEIDERRIVREVE